MNDEQSNESKFDTWYSNIIEGVGETIIIPLLGFVLIGAISMAVPEPFQSIGIFISFESIIFVGLYVALMLLSSLASKVFKPKFADVFNLASLVSAVGVFIWFGFFFFAWSR